MNTRRCPDGTFVLQIWRAWIKINTKRQRQIMKCFLSLVLSMYASCYALRGITLLLLLVSSNWAGITGADKLLRALKEVEEGLNASALSGNGTVDICIGHKGCERESQYSILACITQCLWGYNLGEPQCSLKYHRHVGWVNNLELLFFFFYSRGMKFPKAT